jgi:DNA invertase Pin-like site-specific DNA recombinase
VDVVTYERLSKGDIGRQQREMIEAACAGRGWTVVGRYADPDTSGRTLRRRPGEDLLAALHRQRPGLASAIEAVESGDGSAVVAAKIDRIARSTLDFSELLERSRANGWELVALDSPFDFTSPAGKMMAQLLSVFGEFEREMISTRTREKLASLRAQGVHVGRRCAVPADVRERIASARAAGGTFRTIAADLNAAGVPTGQNGGRWHAASVRRVALAASRSGDASVAPSARPQDGQGGEAGRSDDRPAGRRAA